MIVWDVVVDAIDELQIAGCLRRRPEAVRALPKFFRPKPRSEFASTSPPEFLSFCAHLSSLSLFGPRLSISRMKFLDFALLDRWNLYLIAAHHAAWPGRRMSKVISPLCLEMLQVSYRFLLLLPLPPYATRQSSHLPSPLGAGSIHKVFLRRAALSITSCVKEQAVGLERQHCPSRAMSQMLQYQTGPS